MAFEFLDKIKGFLVQLPRWIWGNDYYGTPEKEATSIFSTESKQELKLIQQEYKLKYILYCYRN